MKTEIELVKLDIKEQEIIIRKYEKKVAKEKAKITQKYKSVEEVETALEDGEIETEERDQLLDYFEGLDTSIDEMFLEYLKRNEKQNIKNLKYLQDQLFKEELVELAREQEV